MSIIIKSLKNTKKIGKDFSKTLKAMLAEKPNLRIGIEWKNDFLKVTNDLKKIKKLDWSQTRIFPLAFYTEKQNDLIFKEMENNFLSEVNFSKENLVNMGMLYEGLKRENNTTKLFTFDDHGGVDLLIFFIDSRGNFVFNDFESKKTYLNHVEKDSKIISAGIKSILSAKKIICFCIDNSSKEIVFNLNKKHIDDDNILTFLHLHNDVTLYTLYDIINKYEINDASLVQNIAYIKGELFNNRDIDSESDETKKNKDNKKDEEIKLFESNVESEKEEYAEAATKEEDDNQNQSEDESDDISDEDFNEIVDTINISSSIDLPKMDDLYHDGDESSKTDDEVSSFYDLVYNNTTEQEEKSLSNAINELHNKYPSIVPEDAEGLEKYIKIKEETLSNIENLIIKNKLVLKEITEKKLSFLKEQISVNEYVDNSKSNYKFEYFEGIRPTPMLMVWHDLNEEFHNELSKEMKEKFGIDFNLIWTKDYNHVWNDGCYIIFDANNNKIISMAFNSDDRLLYLLRYINKNLWFDFNSSNSFNKMNSLLKDNENELRVFINE